MAEHRAAVGLVALAAILIATTVLAFAVTPSGELAPTADSHPDGSRVQFVVECTFSHRAADDPIVHPGHAGASHLHDFFGSTETNASSTAASLLGTPSSCQTSADTAAYWVPTLYHGDAPVDPGRLYAYYRRPPGADPADVVAFPLGLVLLGGDAEEAAPSATGAVAWHCGASPELSAGPVSCPRTAPLTLRVAFPTCWDGTNLDSGDHRSHTRYAGDAGCPTSHPVALPELVLDISYSFWGAPDDLSLASGSTTTAHADFLAAWDPARLEALVDECLRQGRSCGLPPSRSVD